MAVYMVERDLPGISMDQLAAAQCAIGGGRVIWHADEDFEHIRQLSSLRTRRWPAMR